MYQINSKIISELVIGFTEYNYVSSILIQISRVFNTPIINILNFLLNIEEMQQNE